MPPPTYNLTYANIPFLSDKAQVYRIRGDVSAFSDESDAAIRKQQPEVDLQKEIARIFTRVYRRDVSTQPSNASRNLQALAATDPSPKFPSSELVLGNWHYPYGASRFSMFRGYMTSAMVKQLLLNTQGINPATLVMSVNPISPNNQSNTNTFYNLSSLMYLLPPRPIGEGATNRDGLYEITLVDERYWWKYCPVILTVTQNTQWSDLITQLAQSLNITINFTTPLPVYSQPDPDSQLWTNFEPASVLLDAIAANIGTTVVRNLDGTYTLMTSTTSIATVVSNRSALGQIVRTAGGNMFEGPGTSLPVGDLTASTNLPAPASVTVTFPKYVYGNDPVPHYLNARYQNQRTTAWYEDSYGTAHGINVSLASVNTSGLVGISGYIHTIHDTAKALYSGEVLAASGLLPNNQSGLSALATQVATSYYNKLIGTGLDEVYPGTFAWVPEGINDIIWTYSDESRLGVTRVVHGPWNAVTREMQHSMPPLSGVYTVIPPGVGGPSVCQTWRDSQSGASFFNALNQTLNSGDMQAFFATIDFLPTQNRWRGLVDSELILFEGTSGGNTVTIVYRGVDGTVQSQHNNNSIVAQSLPNTSYGTNLVRFEKGQFVYQGIWTSGGISETIVVPQTQTVLTYSASGVTINGTVHYSGEVDAYDPTQTSPFRKQEYIWIVERNAQGVMSGKRYDGQLVAYSASGSISPVYVINECCSGGTTTSTTTPTTTRGSFSGTITTTLTNTLLSGDTTTVLTGVPYFPTIERWVGTINTETIIFEGTSGGTSVGIVQRGAYGTPQAQQANGSTLTLKTVDLVSGNNQLTFEKMQFVYPGTYTPGGTIEARIVPQIQSVLIKSSVPQTLNAISHYSGEVDIYDTTQNSGSQFVTRENCWIVERSAAPVIAGLRRNGQFVGFSTSGAIAPVYAIDFAGPGGLNTDVQINISGAFYGSSGFTVDPLTLDANSFPQVAANIGQTQTNISGTGGTSLLLSTRTGSGIQASTQIYNLRPSFNNIVQQVTDDLPPATSPNQFTQVLLPVNSGFPASGTIIGQYLWGSAHTLAGIKCVTTFSGVGARIEFRNSIPALVNNPVMTLDILSGGLNQWGIFNKVSAQQSGTAIAGGFAAGAGAPINSLSTWTGGTGTTAYSIGDIVLALKNYGILGA